VHKFAQRTSFGVIYVNEQLLVEKGKEDSKLSEARLILLIEQS